MRISAAMLGGALVALGCSALLDSDGLRPGAAGDAGPAGSIDAAEHGSDAGLTDAGPDPRANGQKCSAAAECASGICGPEDVCCDIDCAAIGGRCGDGACFYAVANYSSSCTINEATPNIQFQNGVDLHLCVTGLKPGAVGLGVSGPGDEPCELLVEQFGWAPLNGNPDWTYLGDDRWESYVDSATLAPGVSFTSCFSNDGEGEVIRIYVNIL